MDFVFSKSLLCLLVKPNRPDSILGLSIKSRLKIPLRVFVAEHLGKTGAQAGWVLKVKVYDKAGSTLALLTSSTIAGADTEAHFTGTLNLLTTEILEAIGSADKLDAFIEFRIQDATDNPTEVFATAEPIACTIFKSAITGSEGVPTDANPDYPAPDEIALKVELDAAVADLEGQIAGLAAPTWEQIGEKPDTFPSLSTLIADFSSAVSTVVSGILSAIRGAANGLAELGADGKLKGSQIPAALLGATRFIEFWDAATNTPAIPVASAENKGWYYIVTTPGATSVDGESDWKLGDWIVSLGTKWGKVDNTDAVVSVAGKVGVVTLVRGDVGLGSVPNVDATQRANHTGTQAASTITGWYEELVIACSDESTAITSGTSKVTFRMPFAFTVTEVRASLTVAQASGSIFTVDVNEAGISILSTKLTIDNTERTSTTAATPPVISDAYLADDAEITVDVDQIGTSGAKGLKVLLKGYRS